ncbi:MAG: TonB-dependent receptor domain-containing protein, partial [Gemmatimonadaceae bacterium]
VVPGRYSAKPYDAAAYIQDRIEYDFLTVKLGFRFDYGRAAGSSFADPLDPSNSTTAREVCTGTAETIGATTPFSFTRPSDGRVFTGLAACTESNALRDSASALAQVDDFAAAEARRLFSPRIGVSFPLTERSALFFNFGRFSQNPLYNNLYQNTNVGTTAGAAGGGVCSARSVKPGTNECFPTIFADAYTPAFLGNPNLLIEQTTSYEVGYAAELGRNYAVNVTVFSKDQTGLSGIRQARPAQDIASTYGTSTPRYFVIVNQDYGTSRGIELQFRRRISNFWGFDVNYSYSKATTNAAPPDRQQQSLAEGDPSQLREIRSEIDQPQVFNSALYFRVDDRAPAFRWANLLQNTYLTTTARAASGFTYTPTRSFTGFGDEDQGDVNSGRQPSTFQVDMLAGKDLRLANLRYGVFVRVVNLLDRKNCIQVFVTTGRCDAGTIDQRRARQGNPVGDNTASTYFDRPSFFGPRRSVYAGAKVTF